MKKNYTVKTDKDGTERHYLNGELHREGDLPAVITSKGGMVWYQKGMRHREGDLPADIWPNGSRFWFSNGELHRTNGPAITFYDEYKSWFLNGIELTEEEFNEQRNKK